MRRTEIMKQIRIFGLILASRIKIEIECWSQCLIYAIMSANSIFSICFCLLQQCIFIYVNCQMFQETHDNSPDVKYSVAEKVFLGFILMDRIELKFGN